MLTWKSTRLKFLSPNIRYRVHLTNFVNGMTSYSWQHANSEDLDQLFNLRTKHKPVIDPPVGVRLSTSSYQRSTLFWVWRFDLSSAALVVVATLGVVVVVVVVVATVSSALQCLLTLWWTITRTWCPRGSRWWEWTMPKTARPGKWSVFWLAMGPWGRPVLSSVTPPMDTPPSTYQQPSTTTQVSDFYITLKILQVHKNKTDSVHVADFTHTHTHSHTHSHTHTHTHTHTHITHVFWYSVKHITAYSHCYMKKV